MTKEDYSGVLAEPMRIGVGGIESSAIGDAHRERLEALFAHYEIEPNSSSAGYELALALAEAHVPGFQLEVVRPEDIGWPDGQTRPGPAIAARDLHLVLRVTELIVKREVSTKKACELWVEENPDLGFSSAGAVRQRYMTLTKPDSPDRGSARANLLRLLYGMREGNPNPSDKLNAMIQFLSGDKPPQEKL